MIKLERNYRWKEWWKGCKYSANLDFSYQNMKTNKCSQKCTFLFLTGLNIFHHKTGMFKTRKKQQNKSFMSQIEALSGKNDAERYTEE